MVVVYVQVGNKNILDQLLGMTHGDDVAQAARAKIKEEAVPITEFHHDASPSLITTGGNGVDPMNEMRISSGPSFSLGRETAVVLICQLR